MAVVWKVKGLFKADPVKVYTEITSIGDEYTAEDVLEKAEDESTELHRCFEWNDTVAARKYRLEQAGCIIRNIVLVREEDEDKPEEEQVIVRAIVNTETENGQKYSTIQRVVKNEDMYQALLAKALEELRMFQRKYNILSELRTILDDISVVLNN